LTENGIVTHNCDGATPQLQAGLRGFIEEFHSHCRFILTCNYISKIIQPLREGRVMEFDFNMTDSKTMEEMIPKQIKRLENILKLENVTYSLPVIERLVKENYPNMRKMISGLQKASSMYGTIDENIFRTVAVDSKLYSQKIEVVIMEFARQMEQ
jgi:replication factor C small subunit